MEFIRKNIYSFGKTRVPLIYMLLILAIGCSLFMYFNSSPVKVQPQEVTLNESECSARMNQLRLGGYRFVNPLVLSDLEDDSRQLLALKSHVESYIQQAVSSQKAVNVSVYFRELSNGSKFIINGNDVYNPASLVKVIYLIAYLKEAINDPLALDRVLFFSNHSTTTLQQNIGTFKLKENTYYSVRNLLQYMIQYSDNDATIVLGTYVNKQIYSQIFTDLKLPPVPEGLKEYYVSVADFAKLFRVLHNATYLGSKYSEYALELLTKSEYQDGLRGGLENSVVIAHKFGERVQGNSAQLHEFGIVYIGERPYLLGVMSRGNNLSELSAILREISRIVYADYKGSGQAG